MSAIELPACMTHPSIQSDPTPARSPHWPVTASAATPSTLERWFLHLLKTRPMAFWSGVWLSVFLVGVVAVGSLISPNAAERRSVSAVAVGSDSAVATQPLDTKGKVPVWLFGAIAITCTAGSILVSRQLNPAAVAARPLSRTTRRKLAKHRLELQQAIAAVPALAPAGVPQPLPGSVVSPVATAQGASLLSPPPTLQAALPAGAPKPNRQANARPPKTRKPKPSQPKASSPKVNPPNLNPPKANQPKARKRKANPVPPPVSRPKQRRRWGQRSQPQVKRLQPYTPGELLWRGPAMQTPPLAPLPQPTVSPPLPPVTPPPAQPQAQPAMSFTLKTTPARSPQAPRNLQLAQPQAVSVIPTEAVHPLDWQADRLAELMDVRKTRSLQDWS